MEKLHKLKKELMYTKNKLTYITENYPHKIKKLKVLNKTKKLLETKIANFNNNIPKTLIISDHAMVRYIERILLINTNNIKTILKNKIPTSFKNGYFPLGEELYAVVVDNRVITVTYKAIPQIK